MNDRQDPKRPTWLLPVGAAVAVAALPVVAFLDAGRTGLDGSALVVMRVNGSLVLGTALFALVRWFAIEAQLQPTFRARVVAATLALAVLTATAASPLLEPGDEDTTVRTDLVAAAPWTPPTFPTREPLPSDATDPVPTTLSPAEAALTPPELRPSTTTTRPGTSASTTTTARSGTGTTTPTTSGSTTGPTRPGQTTTTTSRGTSPTSPPVTNPPTTTSPPPTTTNPPAEQPRPLRVLSVGDSTAGVWGVGMDRWGNDPAHRMDVDLAGGPGCALYAPGYAALRPGWDHTQPTSCAGIIDVAISEGRRIQPDVVIMIIGGMQLADWKTSASAAPTSIGNPAYDNAYRQVLTSAIRRLTTELNAPVFLASIPVPRWNPVDAPGSGAMTTNNAARTRRLNEINRGVVAGIARARIAPFGEAVDTADGSVDLRLHPDGLHIDSALVPGVMDAGLAGQLRSLYRGVISAEPGLRRSGVTIWWP